jgi:alkaline phosphatase
MSEQARKADFPDIARQLIEFSHGNGLEVALGGGRVHFLPEGTPDPEDPSQPGRRVDGRDLTQEWVDSRDGSSYVWNRDQLLAIDRDKTKHVLGLFDPEHMKYEVDRIDDAAGEPSLAEMTAFAIDILSKDPDGFFLMVEGGRIDHGHHLGNAYRALSETIAMSDAVRVALEKTREQDTLIVVTADHSHTLTISGYPMRGNPILGKVVGRSRKIEGENEMANDGKGKPYTTLSYANGPGYRDGRRRANLTSVDTEDPEFLQEATIPMRSETHAGEDVPIFAGGTRSALFHGVREQSYIYHAMVEALGWTRAGVPVD